MIDAPVEPEVFKDKDLLQLTPGEWSIGGLAFEVPGTACFGINQLKLRIALVFLMKKLKPPALYSSFEGAHRTIVAVCPQGTSR